MSIGVLADGTTHMILGEFRATGAINRQRAQRFHPSSDAEARVFAQLLELEIIREPERGRYFLDETIVAIQSAHRRPKWPAV